MRTLPFSRTERALLGALFAFLALNYALRFTLASREPFSVIETPAQAVEAPKTAGAPQALQLSGLPNEGEPRPFDLLAFLNEAPAERLAELPGIGPVLAGRIVARREEAGSFRRVEEVTSVPGIGPARLERLLAFAREGTGP